VTATPASVKQILEELTGGLRAGDNVVLQADAEVDAHFVLAGVLELDPERGPVVYVSFRLPPEEIHHRFGSALLVVDCTGTGVAAEPPRNDVGVQHIRDATPAAVREVLYRVTQELGAGATYVFDGLTAMQRRWSTEGALSLFLWMCPKLYEERTIAYWTLERSAHTPAFLAKLAQITQVVIDLGRDGERWWMELRKAHGRSEDLLEGRIAFVVEPDGVQVVDRSPVNRQRVGRLIRRQRIAAGLSQAELARRVGVSPSALSQTERGHHGISGDVLMRVWEALGVPLGDLEAQRSTHRVFPRSSHSAEEIQPGVTAETVVQSADFTVHLLLCEPGASGNRPFFSTKRREFGVVVDGVLQLSIGQSEETLQQGDAILVNDPVRAWANPADVPARAVWALLG